MEQTICSTQLPSGGSLSLSELLPMIQRMMRELTLGEQEKLRLLLITLFSYPSLLNSPAWSSLVQTAELRIHEYVHALSAGEYSLFFFIH